MIKIVPINRMTQNDEITRDMFRNMSPDDRRKFLYSPDDPTLSDDYHALVMTYDEFIEWFPTWNAMYDDQGDNDEWYRDDEGEQYLIDNINRTVTIIDSVEESIPVVFINCTEFPYIDAILKGRKRYETRSRDTLGALVGRTVLIAETGHGKPRVYCEAMIGDVIEVKSYHEFDMWRHYTRVPEFSSHDWKETTRVKYLYELLHVTPVKPFDVPDGVRHGRVWMEYTGEVQY